MYVNTEQYMYVLYKEAEYCKYNMMCADTLHHKTFYENSLNEKLHEIINLLEENSKVPGYHPSQDRGFRQREFTLEELSKYNGVSGNASYVSINGIVYDLSAVQPWASGVHFGVSAGSDVTENFMTCHGASKILDKLPKVGILKNL